MNSHSRPLFIKPKVDNFGVNKVLVDSGGVVNLMPYSLLRKIGKFDTDLRLITWYFPIMKARFPTPQGQSRSTWLSEP